MTIVNYDTPSLFMSMHHTLEEKQEILRLHEAGVSVVELITHFHVIGHIKELSVRLPLS